jgi:hypothetical protein
MSRPLDERLLDDTAVLVARQPLHREPLQAFEAAVLAHIDGRTTNSAVAAAVGIRSEDLRIALVNLLARGFVDAPAVRPALSLVRPLRATPGSSSTLTTPPRTPAPEPKHDDRHGAAALHAMALRELRAGNLKNARAFAEQALSTAPGVGTHRDVIADWDSFVGKHLGATLPARQRVQAIGAWLRGVPSSAAAHRAASHACHEAGDVVAAAEHAQRALALGIVDDTFATWARGVEGEARRFERRQRIRSFFTLTPAAKAPKKHPT